LDFGLRDLGLLQYSDRKSNPQPKISHGKLATTVDEIIYIGGLIDEKIFKRIV
jgi:hypothetical protein